MTLKNEIAFQCEKSFFILKHIHEFFAQIRRTNCNKQALDFIAGKFVCKTHCGFGVKVFYIVISNRFYQSRIYLHYLGENILRKLGKSWPMDGPTPSFVNSLNLTTVRTTRISDYRLIYL